MDGQMELGVASTSHNTPNQKPWMSQVPLKQVLIKKQPSQKRRFIEVLIRGQDHKAKHILKVENNQKAGNVHERNEKDGIKYQAVVEEYNWKHLGIQQKRSLSPLKTIHLKMRSHSNPSDSERK